LSHLKSALGAVTGVVRRFPVPATVLALILGIAAGGAGASPSTAAAPADSPKVEVRTVEKVVEKPINKVMERTPAACLAALDTARTLFGYAADFGTVAGDNMKIASEQGQITLDIIDAISTANVSGITLATAKVKGVTTRLTVNTATVKTLTDKVETAGGQFKTSAAACEAAK
jgi:hypothetical protein